jgi:ubiquinone/menaquinone biosynthesis C-methylase UbiE
MLHHLEPPEKEGTLREVRRVLKPGGLFHLLDFGGSRLADEGYLARWCHAHHRLEDNFGGRILTLLSQAGFAGSKEIDHGRLFFARIAYYRASS